MTRRAPVLPVLAMLALVAGQARAEKPACIQPDDMRTLIRVALPSTIESLADRCKASLPADAFLPSEGAGLAARYRREAPADPVKARHAVEAATGQDLSSFASDDTVFALARGFIDDQIAQHVPVKDCETIDGVVALAANMRADAMSEALLVALTLAGRNRVKGLAICGPKVEGDDR